MKIVRSIRQALLPEDREQETIGGMRIGQTGWTVPWAMWADKSRSCWLHPEYPIREAPFGTANMPVKRDADGYHVNLCGVDSKWDLRDSPGYVGSENLNWIPVVATVSTIWSRRDHA